MMFSNKEKVHLAVSIIVLSLAFGFNDKQQSLNAVSWLFNFIRVLFFSIIIFMVYELVHKLFARRYGAETEYQIWSIKRYGFFRSSKLPKTIFGFTISSFPIGMIISVLATLFSNGLTYIIPLASFNIIEKTHLRISSKFKHLTNFEEAKIAAASLIFLAILAVIITSLNIIQLKQMALMIFMFIAYCLIPISTLDGSKIFFGSVPLYIATIIFIALSYLLSSQFNLIYTFLLAFIGAVMLVFLYLYSKMS